MVQLMNLGLPKTKHNLAALGNFLPDSFSVNIDIALKNKPAEDGVEHLKYEKEQGDEDETLNLFSCKGNGTNGLEWTYGYQIESYGDKYLLWSFTDKYEVNARAMLLIFLWQNHLTRNWELEGGEHNG